MIDHFQISEKLTGLVIFELDNKEFCADIREISAIINPRELEKTGREISDTIKLNDNIIPLIDLHKILGIKSKRRTRDLRIILVELHDSIFAFIVERVKEIFTVSSSLKTKMSFVPNESTFLLGKMCYEGREMLIPDFRKIIEINS